ncbi:ENTH domain-containing protein [Sphaceloma murrayae]|uniref:ENTH domain-containing protein n=1 Tax=Sphaceloma murrayae TaxID=2082308 RepID=A0A2K1QZT2_9PEZI|nr:ENTH domain-containing protein [Sphaceloma murrayae]
MAVTKRTYELAQFFLDSFVRQNILEFDDFPNEDHLVPVYLTQAYRIVYTELSQHLNSTDIRIKRSTKTDDRDREAQISELLRDVDSAKEALLRLGACFSSGAYNVQDGGVTLSVIRKKRELIKLRQPSKD